MAAWSMAGPVQSPPVQSRGGAITLKVDRFDSSAEALAGLAKKYDATIVDRKVDVTEKGRKHGWIRLRVAGKDLSAFLAELRQIGSLYGETIKTTDHTGEIEELGKRMTRLEEHQARLAGVLSSARKLRRSDLLYVQERLFRAGIDHDLLGLQRASLAHDAEQSSVVVSLFEPNILKEVPVGAMAKIGAAFGEGWKDLARSMLAGIGGFVRLLAWLVILVPVGLVVRGQWRRHGPAVRRLLEAPKPPGG
jgi:hypothetical protein